MSSVRGEVESSLRLASSLALTNHDQNDRRQLVTGASRFNVDENNQKTTPLEPQVQVQTNSVIEF